VPLSVVTLSTLSAELRAEGAGLYSLSRNIGVERRHLGGEQLLTTNTQVNHRRHRADTSAPSTGRSKTP